MIKNIALSISSVSTIIHEPEYTMGQWGHGQIACSSEQRNIADIAGLNILFLAAAVAISGPSRMLFRFGHLVYLAL